jgi:peroxiredoxin-like protein
MSDRHEYHIAVTWNSERKGSVESRENIPLLEVATPPEFPKGHPNIWSPEHLYVASANVCLMTTFLAVAENSKLSFNSYKCSGTGILDKVEGKFLMTEITLEPEIEISNESDKEKALKLIEKSEAACLISNSMKTKIILKPTIRVK